MQTSWVVVTDSTRARIFEKKGATQPLNEFEDLYHPSAYQSQNELEHHTRGRSHHSGTFHSHTDDPSVSPLAHQNDLFAKSIALYLDKGRKDARYHRLYLISSPHFLGILRNKLGKEVNRLIENEWSQELSDMSAEEVEKFLREKTVWH